MLEENQSLFSRLISIIGISGVFLYILSLSLPVGLNIAVVFASISGVLVAVLGNVNRFSLKLPLVLPITIFVILSFLSVLISIHPPSSFSLTLPLIPAILIYFLIVELFNVKHIRLLYLAFSIVAIVISLTVLVAFFKSTTNYPSAWITAAKHPLLVVPNDLIFLSLIAPLSVSLVYQKPRSLISIVAIISILLSVSVIIIFQSRGALLTLLFSVTCVAGLLWPRNLKAFAILIVLLILLVSLVIGIDVMRNYALFNKFVKVGIGGRPLVWLITWHMFLDAPLLGHGIHTFWLLLKTYSEAINVSIGGMSWAHNLYVETLAEQGIVGFTSLIAVLLNSLWVSWKTTKAQLQDVRILSIGALAAMLGFCLGAISEITFIRYWCVAMFFSLLAIITVLSFLGGSKNRQTCGETNTPAG
jgi:O-antigen ligase